MRDPLARQIMTETIFVADAHRGDTQRFIVRAREKLTPFMVSAGRCAK